MKLLVMVETPQAVTFAQAWAAATGGSFVLAVFGSSEGWTELGAEKVLVLEPQKTADRAALALVQAKAHADCDSLAGVATSQGRDVLARVAGLLTLPMLSDVLSVESRDGRLVLVRPLYAGNVLARVRTVGDVGVYSIRAAAFGLPEKGSTSPVEVLTLAHEGTGTEWLGLESLEQKRPELSQARVVVSGGRPTRDPETFERLIGALADKLGGAAGATRAAVDAEIAPNELQVGQTGQIVAPELYIAAGISGSIQHLAGMKDSKVIVAINTDPDAPIFEVADYGLVANLHEAIPELISKL